MYQKHKWAAILMTVLLAVVLTACGSSSDKDSSKEKESATKTVTDTMDRKVEVPTTPKRIVALQNVSEMEILGVKPVGTTIITSLHTLRQQKGPKVLVMTNLVLKKSLI